MNHPLKEVSQEQQHNDQSEGYLSIPHMIYRAEVRPNTAESQHQQPLHLQQKEQQQETQQKEQQHEAQQKEQQQEAPESLLPLEKQVQDSQEQQRHSREQIKEVYIQPEIKKHFDLKQMQESHKLQLQHNKRLQTQETKELQTQEKQTQQILTADQVNLSLSTPEQHQKKLFTHYQKQPQKHQLSDKELQQQRQEQHCKKLKKKLVGENQERINFLVQASQAVGLTAGSPAISGQQALAAQVGSLASAVGRRCVLRLAPALKRCLCKGCGTALVYGVNARVRHQSRRQKHLVVTCLTCHTIKRFVNNPKHRLWFEQEEALV